MATDWRRFNIYSNSYTASIDRWSTAALIESDNEGDAQSSQVAIDSFGNAVAVWKQSDGTRYNIWSNRYTASIGSWGTATLIETNNEGDAYAATVAVNVSGNAMAVWQQFDGTGYNIWANRYTASTDSWGTATLIESSNL